MLAERQAARARRIANQRPPVTLHTATVGGSTTGPVPKGEKAKPGKRAATKDEAAWMDAIVRYGCIACRLDGRPPRPTAVHHILRGGVRLGHKHTIGLCDPGHHQNGGQFGLTSRHPYKARFEAKYGTELQLLAHLQLVLVKQPDGSYAP
jgi:hypothetical protein